MKCLLSILLIILTTHIPSSDDYVQHLPGTDLSIYMIHVSSDENQDANFYMSAHEVTWDLYKLFLNREIDHTSFADKADQLSIEVDGISGASVPYVDMSLGMGTGPGLPVCNITPKAAGKFCQWLSAITGRFYRLPTEKEWLLAAQNSQIDNQEMSAWYIDNAANHYHPVGEKEGGKLGIHDLYGNVAEWTLDPQSASAMEDFLSTARLKGGSYLDDLESLHHTNSIFPDKNWKDRDPQFPKSKWWFTDAPFAGFRIVNPVQTPPEAQFPLYWGKE